MNGRHVSATNFQASILDWAFVCDACGIHINDPSMFNLHQRQGAQKAEFKVEGSDLATET